MLSRLCIYHVEQIVAATIGPQWPRRPTRQPIAGMLFSAILPIRLCSKLGREREGGGFS
jgi:hypothetical protein